MTVLYKGMSAYDDKGQLIDSLKRPTLFPSFNGDEEGVEIAGFLTTDKKLASYYADNYGDNGAVFMYKLNKKIKTLTLDGSNKNAGDLQFGQKGKDFRDAIRSKKYDLIVLENTQDEGDVFVLLNNKAIVPLFEKKIKQNKKLKL